MKYTITNIIFPVTTNVCEKLFTWMKLLWESWNREGFMIKISMINNPSLPSNINALGYTVYQRIPDSSRVKRPITIRQSSATERFRKPTKCLRNQPSVPDSVTYFCHHSLSRDERPCDLSKAPSSRASCLLGNYRKGGDNVSIVQIRTIWHLNKEKSTFNDKLFSVLCSHIILQKYTTTVSCVKHISPSKQYSTVIQIKAFVLQPQNNSQHWSFSLFGNMADNKV